MFTVFHLFRLVGVLAGIPIGAKLGSRLGGPVGVVLGAVLGAVLGYVLSSLPELLVVRAWAREYSGKSTDELRAELHGVGCLTVNLHLLELRRRGEDINGELPFLLDLLCSDSRERRIRGWAALTSVFPDAAASIVSYHIDDPPEARRSSVAPLRHD